MLLSLKSWLRHYYWLYSLGMLVKDFFLPPVDNQTNDLLNGSCSLNNNLDKILAYIRGNADFYRRNLRIDHFHGNILEIGPGDNCGFALLALADGAEQIDLIDRWKSRRCVDQVVDIYQTLIHDDSELRRRMQGCDLRNNLAFPGIHWYIGTEGDVSVFLKKPPRTYDFILSIVVLELVNDLSDVFLAMAKALKSGGMMCHLIDLTGHGLLAPSSHPLTYLKIPEWLWVRIGRKYPMPNRHLFSSYQEALRKTGLDYQILVSGLVGVEGGFVPMPWERIDVGLRGQAIECVQTIRPSLPLLWREMSDQDLSINQIIVVASKGQLPPEARL